jgi:hypothetical protein
MKIIEKIFFVLFLFACDDRCYPNGFVNYTNYSIKPNTESPMGIPIDSSGQWVDVYDLDKKILDLQDCMGVKINLDCLEVKIAPDWEITDCAIANGAYEETFPCDIPDYVCTSKGLIDTGDCDCRCRAIIQDDDYIVTTPNLNLFKAALARMIIGYDPWSDSEIAKCL